MIRRFMLPLCVVFVSGVAVAQPQPSASRATTYDTRIIAEEIERRFDAVQLDELKSLFDFEAIVDSVMAGVHLSPDIREGVRAGLLRGIAGDNSWFNSLSREAEEYDGELRLVGLRERAGGVRPLFRFSSDVGINYHEYVIATVEGKPKIVDVLAYTSGELITDSLTRTVALSFKDTSSSWISKLFGNEPPLPKAFDRHQEVIDAIRKNDSVAAFARFQELEEPLKLDKLLLVGMYKVAATSGDKEHVLAILDEIEKRYPNDPILLIAHLDKYGLLNDLDGVLAAIDRLDKKVGGDPYLCVLRSETLLKAGEIDKAALEAQKAVQALPVMEQPLWTLLDAQLAQKDYKASARTLNKLETWHNVEFGDPRDYDAYDEFIESISGKEWLVRHGYE